MFWCAVPCTHVQEQHTLARLRIYTSLIPSHARLLTESITHLFPPPGARVVVMTTTIFPTLNCSALEALKQDPAEYAAFLLGVRTALAQLGGVPVAAVEVTGVCV